MNKVNKQ